MGESGRGGVGGSVKEVEILVLDLSMTSINLMGLLVTISFVKV